MIPSSFVQDVLDRTDIVELVSRHVELKRGGANFMGLCPFHAEKSPSFSVSPGKQFYYCFGCGASGDAIRFLTEMHGLSFVDAIEDLAQRLGLAVPREMASPEEREQRQKLRERRLSLTEVLQRAAAFYKRELKGASAAVAYLKKRGLSGEIAARFGLGWAADSYNGLARAFDNYDEPLLEEAGLVRVRGKDDDAGSDSAAARRYDWFRGRVMFPIHSVQGEVIGFGGRVLDDSKPKYMNSPETAVFSKGRELYGLFEARQPIREAGYALVVEGYMDVVALAQHGFANAVATLGTACTGDHVAKLFRFTDAVVFSFDGDAAGRRAAGRALEAALPHVGDLRSVKFLFLPSEHDPDSFVRDHGHEAFAAEVARAVPLSRQLIEHAGEDADLRTAEGRARLLAKVKPLWLAVGESELKRQLLGEIARAAETSAEELARQWAPAPAAASAGGAGSARAASWRGRIPLIVSRKPPAAAADLALRLLLAHADWWEGLAADDQALLLGLPGDHGRAVAWLEQQVTEHGPLTWAQLEEYLRGHELHETLRTWAAGALLAEMPHDTSDLERVLHQLWINQLGEQAQLIAAGAADAAMLQTLRGLRDRIARHKAALIALAAKAAAAS